MARTSQTVATGREGANGGGPTAEQCFEMGQTCACFNLRRASRAVTQLFDAHFDEIGLKATQFTVLANLAYENERATEPTVTELAESLVLEQSSLSRNLSVLERLGYVRLVPGADRRERNVQLTRTGRAALARGYPIWRRAQSAMAAALEDELTAQLKGLRRLTRAAQDLRRRDAGELPELTPTVPRKIARSARMARTENAKRG
jgi:DNA-binding MarR family transcriptional regulator